MKVLLAVLMFGRFLKEIYVTGNQNESDPLQLYIKQGGEAVLQCIYESSRLQWDARKNVNLSWTHIADGKDTVNDTKYKVSTKPSTVLYSRFHVLNTQPGDELIYRCNAGLNKENFFQLNLYVPPSKTYFNGSMANKLEGIEGTDLLIRCIAVGGKPPPEVSILDGNRPSNTQEVSYRIPMISRDYHQKSIVCQATSDALDNPMSSTVQIYLNLKPLTPIFSTNEVSTEETLPLTVSCTSYGSLPVASFTWTIGGNDVTSSSSTSPPVTESNDTKTVTSKLTLSVDRNNDKQRIICNASNNVDSVSASKTLDVKYAPDITVNNHTYEQTDAIRNVTCNPSGNPDSYRYHKWLHKSKYGVVIQKLSGNKTLKLSDVSVEKRYQDTGEYVCIASNGIKDKNNELEQTGSGYVTVNAQPVFTIDRVKQFGEITKTVDIYVNVYSVPKFQSFIWIRDGTPIITHNAAKYESASSPTIVKDKFHGKEIQLDGYNVTLTIRDLKAEDFTNYTVTLKHGFGSSAYTIILESASRPGIPGNFSNIASSSTSITVQWDPNLGGGYKQTFYIQYRVQGSSEWTSVSAGEEDIDEQRRRRTYEVRNLEGGTAYELRMCAENTAMKRSNFTDVLIVFTESSVSTTSTAVIGAVVAVVFTLMIVCASFIVILLIKRSQGKDKKEKNDKYYENTGFQDIQNGDEYEEVENKIDVEHTQSSKTYETLGTKDNISVYDDLENAKGVTSSKSSIGDYESLGVQDKPSIYSEMKNQKEHRQLRKQQADKKQFKKPNDPGENTELNTSQVPTEKVYENEVF